MLTPLVVGIFTGIVSTLCWIVVKALLSLPGVDSALSNYGYLFPLAITVIAIFLHSFFQDRYKTSSLSDLRRQAFVNIFELFHLGVRPLESVRSIMRAMLNFLNALIGGVVGVEGYLIGLNIAIAPILSPAFSFVTENRQMFIVCTFTAAISAVFHAPFSAALIVVGFVKLKDAKLRFAAILTSFITYGTTSLLQHVFDSGPMMVMGSLFSSFQPISLDSSWFLLLAVAIGIGGLCSVFAYFSSHILAYADQFFSHFFGPYVHIRLLVMGFCMAVTVWLVPAGYHVPWRLWEIMSEQQLSSGGAIIIFLELWILLIFVLTAMGTIGLFSSFITLGALLGYAIGSHFIPMGMIPLAIVGGASLLSAVFEIPFAASALILDIGHDSSLWLLASCGILASSLLSKLLKVKSLQDTLMQEKGLRIVNGKMGNVLTLIKISEVMSQDVKIIAETSSFEQLREVVKHSFYNYIGIISSVGKFLGVIDLERLPQSIRRMLTINNNHQTAKTVEQILDVKELMIDFIPKLLITDSAEKTLQLFEENACIAIVDEKDNFKGFVFEDTVLVRYKREVPKIILRESDSSS